MKHSKFKKASNAKSKRAKGGKGAARSSADGPCPAGQTPVTTDYGGGEKYVDCVSRTLPQIIQGSSGGSGFSGTSPGSGSGKANDTNWRDGSKPKLK